MLYARNKYTADICIHAQPNALLNATSIMLSVQRVESVHALYDKVPGVFSCFEDN